VYKIKKNKMKVVLLAGGLETRISEESQYSYFPHIKAALVLIHKGISPTK